jgi:CubicO group peptidase (beta-lactamase class C family)
MQLMPGAYVRVPKNLRSLVSIDAAAETAPGELGLNPTKVDAAWRAVEQMFATGLQPAITLVVKRHGRTVLKRSIGAVRGLDPGVDEPQVALQPDSPMCLFSASKSISALLVHKLIEDGKLSLDDRVAAYIPEFAARGKHRVTLRELMAHRAAIPSLTVETQGAELLKNWDVLIATLCAARPVDREFRQQAYHALTAGFILGEVVQRVGQISLPDALDQWIAKPLGCQHLQYGASLALREQMPRNVVTGLKPVWPLSAYIRSIIGVDMEEGVAETNTDPFLSAVVPAGNLTASAEDANRVFQMLLNGGRFEGKQLFKPETVARAIEPVGPIQFDRTLKLPMRFSAGFMLGEKPFGLFGPQSQRAFGHLGFVNVLCWADPHRALSVALLTSGKSVSPNGVLHTALWLRAMAQAFPKL